MVSVSSNANGLDQLRASFAKYVTYFIWFNVVLVVGTSLVVGSGSWMVLSVAAFALGLGATLTAMKFQIGVETRVASAISLAGLVALFVAALASENPITSYQIDGHLYFFAVLAILAGWVDWRALIAYAAVVAVHHLVFNFALPAAVFPNGTDLLRVIFHAVIVVVEVGVLWWLVESLSRAFESADGAIRDAATAQEREKELHGHEAQRAEDDRQRQINVNRRIESFRVDVEGKIANVAEQVAQMRDASASLGGVARHAAQQTDSATSASEAALGKVQVVATAAQQLAGSIAQIGRQVDETTKIVDRATKGAQTSNEKVAGLADAANRIGEVVTMIQAIAEQTNLLALNATIEAARAGEAGKGFAVVAAEVKELATQTARATEEIATQITAIQDETRDAVEAIGAIAETMEQVNEYTSDIAAAIVEQGSATQDISRNASDVASSTELVSKNIGGLSEAVEQTTFSADAFSDAAEELQKETHEMGSSVESFLKGVAAA